MDNGLGCGGGEGEEEELLEWEGGWFVRASVATAAGGCLSPALVCAVSPTILHYLWERVDLGNDAESTWGLRGRQRTWRELSVAGGAVSKGSLCYSLSMDASTQALYALYIDVLATGSNCRKRARTRSHVPPDLGG